MRPPASDRLATAGLGAALAACATAVGLLATLQPAVAAALCGVVLLIGLVVAATPVKGSKTGVGIRWIPIAWVATVLASAQKLAEPRTPLEAASANASTDNLIEVGVYLVVGLATVVTWRRMRSFRPSSFGALPILAGPAVALASAIWSQIPIFSLVRGMQLAVLAGLAWVTAAVIAMSENQGHLVLIRTVRLLVLVTSSLCVWGFVIRDYPDERFTWPGAHPGVAATIMGAALIGLLVVGRVKLRWGPLVYWSQAVLLGTGIVLSLTRGVWGGVLIAIAAAAWVRGRSNPLIRYAGIVLGVVLAIGVPSVAREEIVQYASRGQSSEAIESFSGRIPLWQVAIDEVRSEEATLFGFGYGASRIILYEEVEWAGTAHNAGIELLMAVGLVGASIWAVGLLLIGYRLLRASLASGSRLILACLALYTFLLVTSVVSEAIVMPGIGFAAYALVASVALASRAQEGEQTSPTFEGRRVQPSLGLSPRPT